MVLTEFTFFSVLATSWPPLVRAGVAEGEAVGVRIRVGVGVGVARAMTVGVTKGALGVGVVAVSILKFGVVLSSSLLAEMPKRLTSLFTWVDLLARE